MDIVDLIRYEPETGKFYSLVSNSNVKVGQEVKGSVDNKGYIRIGVGGRVIRAHRLAFICMGENLPNQVDHIDRDKQNNKWSNLRASDQQTNQWNTSERKTNTSGHKNVYWRPERRHWQVRIPTKDCRSKYIGSYKEYGDAVKAAEQARRDYQKEYGYSVR